MHLHKVRKGKGREPEPKTKVEWIAHDIRANKIITISTRKHHPHPWTSLREKKKKKKKKKASCKSKNRSFLLLPAPPRCKKALPISRRTDHPLSPILASSISARCILRKSIGDDARRAGKYHKSQPRREKRKATKTLS